MNGEVALERRYRRLLAWYPADYRRAYGEEMVGVLLASAPRRTALAGVRRRPAGARAARRHTGIGVRGVADDLR